MGFETFCKTAELLSLTRKKEFVITKYVNIVLSKI